MKLNRPAMRNFCSLFLAIVVVVVVLLQSESSCGFQLQSASTINKNIHHRHQPPDHKEPGFSPPLSSSFLSSSTSSQRLSTRYATPASDDATSSTTPTLAPIDYGAIGRYVLAFIIQMTLITTVLSGVDVLVGRFVVSSSSSSVVSQIPFGVNFVFFYLFALKSRIFNPMSNARPKPSTKEIEDQPTADNNDEAVAPPPPRKMPEWTPPGFIFPIVWLLIIGPLRAASSSLVVSTLLQQASSSTTTTAIYASTAILSLMAHLSIGDIWNTINNTERRYGTSVVGVILVWISAAFAAYQYSLVTPLGGKLLSLPLIWLTIASSLIFRTWQLNNPNPVTGRPYSFIPRLEQDTATIDGMEQPQEKTITKLIWFEKW